MSNIGAPAPHDIFTDNTRWADLAEWNRAATALHEQDGIHRIERDGFTPFWAVIDHAAVLDVERRPALFTNEPQPVLASREAIDSQLARNELRSLFSQIVPRIKSIELAGDPATMQTTSVGGHKSLPIRYELTN